MPDFAYEEGTSTVDLTPAQQRLLWTLAQHKYGWTYVSGIGFQSAARALERRGLVEIADWDFRVTLTTAGEREANLRFPISPLSLGTYATREGGWPLAPASERKGQP